ncbi:MAG: glutamate synthase subunit beta [Polyangiaceae bacterium]|nr:glutamate synthase subunit beta [Polyangiaceae bacterium]
MGDPRGFLQIGRKKGASRDVAARVGDFREFEATLPEDALREQASRCMDCGIPFCHKGCPLGNLIPEWNDHVYRGRMEDAFEALLATNNFPEVTGRVCPAPCEAACVLNIEKQPVTIKEVERFLGERINCGEALAPRPAALRKQARVAVVGSGPAGLAAAQQLARKGYEVTVFERSDRIGGLLRYGIPDFKLEKDVIDRRIGQMQAEGVAFRAGVEAGVHVTARELRQEHDAILLAVGASEPRDLTVEGRHLRGVHPAMEFLTQANKKAAGDAVLGQIVATGKNVIILGGGDTGSDCLGTSHRQRAKSVTQLELMPAPPGERAPSNPWPEWPLVFRTSSSQEEGGVRDFAVQTKRLLGDDRGQVRALEAARVELRAGRLVEIEGSTFAIPCELVLLAMGFTGVEKKHPLLAQLGVALDARTNVAHSAFATGVEGVFVAGDAARGASLVVWAIAEGRRAADEIDRYLSCERERAAE